MLNPLGNINPQTKTRQKLEQTTNQNLSECVSTKTSATHKIETSQSVSPQNHQQPKNWNLSKCVFTRNIMNPQTKTSRKVSPQKHEPSYETPTKNNQQPTNSKPLEVCLHKNINNPIFNLLGMCRHKWHQPTNRHPLTCISTQTSTTNKFQNLSVCASTN